VADGNLGYILAAYGLAWGAIGAYLVRRWRRLAELMRDGGSEQAGMSNGSDEQ
jgi:hypothetical protein